jgi:hypothetical protein
MPRYYFDSDDDGDQSIVDDIGVELPDLDAVKLEASRALADLARDVLPGSIRRELSVSVRDRLDRPVLKALMVFEVQILADET